MQKVRGKPFVYKGYEIEVWRDRAMGGWDSVYFTVVRLSDNYILADDFTSGGENINTMKACMRNRVDEDIKNPEGMNDQS